MMSWSPKHVEMLISQVRERPSLYDHRTKSYKNKGSRQIAMQEIARNISEVRGETTPDDCRRKWHSVRTNYMSERRKVLKSIADGGGEDSIYIPSLFYFHEMKFLDEHTQVTHGPTLDDDAEDSCGLLQSSHHWSVDGPSPEESMVVETPVEAANPPMNVTTPRFLLLNPTIQRAIDLPRNETDRQTTATTTIGPPRPHKMKRSERLEHPQGNSVNDLLESATNVLGTLSQRTTSQPDDMEEAYGKYVTQRLRSIPSDQVRAAIIFEIDKIFYEYSKK